MYLDRIPKQPAAIQYSILKAEDLIKGVVKHNRLDEPSSTQRLVKIKIESVEYMK